MLKTFHSLKGASDFRRHHMSFLQTLEDMDLVREIGLYQARGHPMTLKLLFTKGIASVATVQRRLERLRRLGVVEQCKSDSDKRVVHLTLSPSVLKLHRKLVRVALQQWRNA